LIVLVKLALKRLASAVQLRLLAFMRPVFPRPPPGALMAALKMKIFQADFINGC
jgi:hypothetical protein